MAVHAAELADDYGSHWYDLVLEKLEPDAGSAALDSSLTSASLPEEAAADKREAGPPPEVRPTVSPWATVGPLLSRVS